MSLRAGAVLTLPQLLRIKGAGTNLDRFSSVPGVFTFSQAVEAPTPNLFSISPQSTPFPSFFYEHARFRALACLNNVHFSARAPCPGTGTKSERGLTFNREIKIPVYAKRQTSDSRYPSSVIYVTFFCLSST